MLKFWEISIFLAIPLFVFVRATSNSAYLKHFCACAFSEVGYDYDNSLSYPILRKESADFHLAKLQIVPSTLISAHARTRVLGIDKD